MNVYDQGSCLNHSFSSIECLLVTNSLSPNYCRNFVLVATRSASHETSPIFVGDTKKHSTSWDFFVTHYPITIVKSKTKPTKNFVVGSKVYDWGRCGTILKRKLFNGLKLSFNIFLSVGLEIEKSILINWYNSMCSLVSMKYCLISS